MTTEIKSAQNWKVSQNICNDLRFPLSLVLLWLTPYIPFVRDTQKMRHLRCR